MTEVTVLGSDLPHLVIVGIVAAGLLFWCRTKLLLLYGAIEIVVGLSLMVLASKVHGTFDSSFSTSFDTVRTTIAVTTYLGAIFAMVRGFDNIRTALCKMRSATRHSCR